VILIKKGLIIKIADKDYIAYVWANAFRALGAELAITYSNETDHRGYPVY
jgi:enoyl-[acyl-carrier-protein] reductase (NADH)